MVSKTQNRIGYNLWLSALDGGLYIHFKPENTGIEYQNLHLFASKAISLNFDMGYEENINYSEKKYKPIYVNGDFLETDNHDATADGFSPQTGDICNVTSVVVLLAVSIFVVIIASKKRKNLITKTQ